MSDTSAEKIQREDVSLTTKHGHPALKIGEVKIMLRATFEGAPPRTTEKDHHGEGPYFVLDFDEEYFDGLLEIEPAFVPAGKEEAEA